MSRFLTVCALALATSMANEIPPTPAIPSSLFGNTDTSNAAERAKRAEDEAKEMGKSAQELWGGFSPVQDINNDGTGLKIVTPDQRTNQRLSLDELFMGGETTDGQGSLDKLQQVGNMDGSAGYRTLSSAADGISANTDQGFAIQASTPCNPNDPQAKCNAEWDAFSGDWLTTALQHQEDNLFGRLEQFGQELLGGGTCNILSDLTAGPDREWLSRPNYCVRANDRTGRHDIIQHFDANLIRVVENPTPIKSGTPAQVLIPQVGNPTGNLGLTHLKVGQMTNAWANGSYDSCNDQDITVTYKITNLPALQSITLASVEYINNIYEVILEANGESFVLATSGMNRTSNNPSFSFPNVPTPNNYSGHGQCPGGSSGPSSWSWSQTHNQNIACTDSSFSLSSGGSGSCSQSPSCSHPYSLYAGPSGWECRKPKPKTGCEAVVGTALENCLAAQPQEYDYGSVSWTHSMTYQPAPTSNNKTTPNNKTPKKPPLNMPLTAEQIGAIRAADGVFTVRVKTKTGHQQAVSANLVVHYDRRASITDHGFTNQTAQAALLDVAAGLAKIENLTCAEDFLTRKVNLANSVAYMTEFGGDLKPNGIIFPLGFLRELQSDADFLNTIIQYPEIHNQLSLSSPINDPRLKLTVEETVRMCHRLSFDVTYTIFQPSDGQTMTVPKYDTNGNIVFDDNGEPVFEEILIEGGEVVNNSCAILENNGCRPTGRTKPVEGAENPLSGEALVQMVEYDCGVWVPNFVATPRAIECEGMSIPCLGDNCGIEQSNDQFYEAAGLMMAVEQIQKETGSCNPEKIGDCVLFDGAAQQCKQVLTGNWSNNNNPFLGKNCCVFDDQDGFSRWTKTFKSLMRVETLTAAEKELAQVQELQSSFDQVIEDGAKGEARYTIIEGNLVDNADIVMNRTQSINQNPVSPEEEKKHLGEQIDAFLTRFLGVDYGSTVVGGGSAILQYVYKDQIQDFAVDQLSKVVGEQIAGSMVPVLGQIYFAATLVNLGIDIFFGCTPEEIKLYSDGQAGLCHAVGSYCDGLFCGQTQQASCCYNDPLARIIAQGVRHPKAPALPGVQWTHAGLTLEDDELAALNCSGIRVSDLGKVDWSKVDFKQYILLLGSADIDLIPNPHNGQLDMVERLTGEGSRLDFSQDDFAQLERAEPTLGNYTVPPALQHCETEYRMSLADLSKTSPTCQSAVASHCNSQAAAAGISLCSAIPTLTSSCNAHAANFRTSSLAPGYGCFEWRDTICKHIVDPSSGFVPPFCSPAGEHQNQLDYQGCLREKNDAGPYLSAANETCATIVPRLCAMETFMQGSLCQ